MGTAISIAPNEKDVETPIPIPEIDVTQAEITQPTTCYCCVTTKGTISFTGGGPAYRQWIWLCHVSPKPTTVVTITITSGHANVYFDNVLKYTVFPGSCTFYAQSGDIKLDAPSGVVVRGTYEITAKI